MFAFFFLTVNSAEGLPQKQLICGAEVLGPAAGADRGAVWGVGPDADGGGVGGRVGFEPGTGAKSTGGGKMAPQSAFGTHG